MEERGYWGREISTLLEIGDSTLRKWCLALESQGYTFVRGVNNSRAFVDKDVIILKRMKDLVQDKSIKLEVAAQIVMAGMEPAERTESVPGEERSQNYLPSIGVEVDKLEQILQFQEEQQAFNKALLQKLEDQHVFYESRIQEINKRSEEREKLFLQTIKELQQERNLIETAEQKKSEEQIKEREEQAEEREQFIIEAIKEIKKNEESNKQNLEESLNKRDRLLQQQLEEIQETKRLIAANNEQKKPGFFSRLFQRN
ncbi:DUF3967 domain-containing protein [Bacillus cereus]|nr:DUF3967 domain-containing protein [Bacillus cereus]MEC3260698.1 DUF3967 domain-containing protein [Bacillus cereus]